MKKIITLIMCMALALLSTGCGQNAEVSLKPGIYKLHDAQQDVPGDFTISIYDDGTFQCYETPISSYIGMGHYSIENGVVTLKEDLPGCTGDINYYQIADGKLSFICDGSANYHFVPLEDGTLLEWMSDNI